MRKSWHAYQVKVLKSRTTEPYVSGVYRFEDGQFEKANELKSALETHQRATRAKRERGELPPHGPRWFERKMEEDTQQGYWEPRRLPNGELEYWEERNENYRRIQNGETPHWNGVEEIFGVRL